MARQFGRTWWGRAWVDALENRARLDPNRLPRGRTYARQERVSTLRVDAGEVTAFVRGGRPGRYRVLVRVRTFDDDEWDRLVAAIAGRAGHAAALLDGELDPEVAVDARDAGVDLLPGPGDLRPRCSCPDWADPCKHAAAVCYLVADVLDDDPFALFHVRGRTREALLGRAPGPPPGRRGGARGRGRLPHHPGRRGRGGPPGRGERPPTGRREPDPADPIGTETRVSRVRPTETATGGDHGRDARGAAAGAPSQARRRERPARAAVGTPGSADPAPRPGRRRLPSEPPVGRGATAAGPSAGPAGEAATAPPAVRRAPLPSRPGCPAPWPSDPPADAPFTAEGLRTLAADAARRAWAQLRGEGGAGLDLDEDADLARRAATLGGRAPALAALARVSGVAADDLDRLARAWDHGGAPALAVLGADPWRPPVATMAAARDAVVESLPAGARVHATANRITAGALQLRLDPAGRWWRFEKHRGRWDLTSPPADQPDDLLDLPS